VYLKYKLYENSDNNTSNVLEEVLRNRGVDDYEKYLNLNEDVLIPYENLDNMNKAVELFMKN
jgi:single-stranded-DNA-specific exonuclease